MLTSPSVAGAGLCAQPPEHLAVVYLAAQQTAALQLGSRYTYEPPAVILVTTAGATVFPSNSFFFFFYPFLGDKR